MPLRPFDIFFRYLQALPDADEQDDQEKEDGEEREFVRPAVAFTGARPSQGGWKAFSKIPSS